MHIMDDDTTITMYSLSCLGQAWINPKSNTW